MNNQLQPSLLLLGGTKTGKTHYGGQFLRRLQKGQGELQMMGVPSDLTPFQEVNEALSQGKSGAHTPVIVYRESIWSIRQKDSMVDAELIWPDYGGEQLERLITQRQVSEEWVHRIRSSDGWLLFLRLKILPVLEDMLTRPRTLDQMKRLGIEPNHIADGTLPDGHASPEDGVSLLQSQSLPPLPAQVQFVELLQTLFFIKQVSTIQRLAYPPLTVVLSCWDELHDETQDSSVPYRLLKVRLPFFARFIEANWVPDAIEVMGLSALGKSLRSDVVDEDFVDNGPERQGYCILPDGTKSSDLTLPISRLLKRVAPR